MNRFVTEWESGKPETPCGKGSRFDTTGIIRGWLPEVIRTYGIRTIADMGCGDQNWIHHCLPDDVEYQGYDVMPRRQDVLPFDITREVLRDPVDLILCIYVLNHLYTPELIQRSVRLMKESGSKYLLATYREGDMEDEGLIERMHHKTKTYANNDSVDWHYGLWSLNEK